MTARYFRVMPRDLFNEGNLLKCYGQLALQLLDHPIAGVELVRDEDWKPFTIAQDQDDGSLRMDCTELLAHGHAVALYRPLNSRSPWPLWAVIEDEAIPVFDDQGAFDAGFLSALDALK